MADSKKLFLQETLKVHKKRIKKFKKYLEEENDPKVIKYFKEKIEHAKAQKRSTEIRILINNAKEHGEDTTLLQKELDNLEEKYLFL